MARFLCTRRRRTIVALGLGDALPELGPELAPESPPFESTPGARVASPSSTSTSSSCPRNRICACLSTKDSSKPPFSAPLRHVSPPTVLDASDSGAGSWMSGTQRASSTSPSYSPTLFPSRGGALCSTSFSSASLILTILALTAAFSSHSISASRGACKLGSFRKSSHAITSFPLDSRDTSRTSRSTSGLYTARSTASLRPHRLGHSMAHT
mmetsp:Transcript_6280/g.25469  ORF Transcript_6280/g.25469 Transcript_6280/m.25469 type:complete len:211 (+) Transcript_6280:885-1517(+)